MANLIELQREADLLTEEERVGLTAHLLSTFSSPPLGPDDAEADRRDLELDSGAVKAISHDEFIRQVGRS